MKTLQLMIALAACTLGSAAMASAQIAAADAPVLLAKAEKKEKAEKAEKKEKVGAQFDVEFLAKKEKAEKAEKKEKVGVQFEDELLAKNETSHGGRPRRAGKRGA